MKMSQYILMVFIASFVLFANDGFACGSNSTTTATKSCSFKKAKSSCTTAKKLTQKPCCHAPLDKEDGCGGDCGDSACHCSPSVNMPFVEAATLEITQYVYIPKQVWNFAQNPLKPVYLPIWKPPNIA